ncbi:hypothetical protein FE772_02900 [Lysobacter enzymogenes]|nr:hypothetical protein FE772_02900 [Lysobacter enzymogenes]
MRRCSHDQVFRRRDRRRTRPGAGQQGGRRGDRRGRCAGPAAGGEDRRRVVPPLSGRPRRAGRGGTLRCPATICRG